MAINSLQPNETKALKLYRGGMIIVICEAVQVGKTYHRLRVSLHPGVSMQVWRCGICVSWACEVFFLHLVHIEECQLISRILHINDDIMCF